MFVVEIFELVIVENGHERRVEHIHTLLLLLSRFSRV